MDRQLTANAALRPAVPDPDLIADLEACHSEHDLKAVIGHPTPYWQGTMTEPAATPRQTPAADIAPSGAYVGEILAAMHRG